MGETADTDYRISFRLADVVDGQLMLARAQGMHILADVPRHLTAYGRPADVAEVLQNLLTNARHHARSSPVTIRATPFDDHVLLRVEDRGPGVAGPEKDAIFERGRRASSAEGSGLGLYVSARLIEDQDGRLTVEDRPGGGASFVLRLPCEPT